MSASTSKGGMEEFASLVQERHTVAHDLCLQHDKQDEQLHRLHHKLSRVVALQVRIHLNSKLVVVHDVKFDIGKDQENL